MISVILVQHNNAHLTIESLRSLRERHPSKTEIFVVDNASNQPREDILTKEFEGLIFIQNSRNVGFGTANNIAASKASGEILLFLNNDTLFKTDILGAIAARFDEDPTVGVIGPKLMYPDGRFQLSAGGLPGFFTEIGDRLSYGMLRKRVRLWEHLIENRFRAPKSVGWVTGAALFIRRSIFDKLGGFDEDFFMYFEDKDLCLRVRDAGLNVLFDPSVSLFHLKAGSSASESPELIQRIYRQSQIAYYKKHRPGIEQALLRAYLASTGKFYK